jgi:diadenosine tetraphosphatase ApaH/serine/threonine PP2A family protein phosphatase
MRYAIFSDVHSNLEALKSVLEVFQESKIDRYLFVGDIVGYGANPKECIATLRRLDAVCVAGNHDWAVVNKTSPEYFNKDATEAISWTQKNITETERTFLLDLKLVKEEEKYCLVHGTLSHPEEFDYMFDASRAMKTFYLLNQKICFVGHSHCPGVFIEEEERVSYQEPDILKIEEGRRYIVNDGSVGQPRNGDCRACFCIYDDLASTIEFKRIEYDIEGAKKKIIEAGLPRILAERLSVGM